MNAAAFISDCDDIPPFSHFGGRQDEMARLLLGLERSFNGNGQAFLMTGEAGLGKTRLLQELLRQARQEYKDFIVIKHSFLPAGTAQDSLFRSLFRQCRDFLFPFSESVDQQCSAIAEKIGLMQPLMLQMLHYLLSPREQEKDKSWNDLNLNTKKNLSSSIIWDFINYISTCRPVIILIEDIHWADAELKFILQDLQGKLSNRKVLVVLTSRADSSADGMQVSSIETVKLPPLASSEQLDLLDHWLGNSPTLKGIKREMVLVAAGNPFFLREIALTIESGGCFLGKAGSYICVDKSAEFAMPLTLQNLLEQQFQSLSPDDRAYISHAASIGQSFSGNLLKELLAADGAILQKTLAGLAGKNIISPVAGASSERWQFRHSLIHEIAYGMCAPEEKRRIHMDIFRLLQKLHRRERDVSLCAYHAFRAELHEEAFLYSYLAGNAAMNEAESRNAIAHFENAVASLQKLPAGYKNRERYLIKCKMGLALALSICGQHSEAGSVIRKTEILLDRIAERRTLENKIKTLSLFDLWIQGDLVNGIETGTHILETIDIHQDSYSYITAAIRLAGLLQDHGRYGDSNKVLLRIQPFFNEMNASQRYGLLFSAATLCHAMMARNLGELGDFAAARKCAAACLTFTRENKNPLALIYGLAYASAYLIRAELFSEALPLYAEAFEACGGLKTNLLYPFVAAHYGYALFRAGNKAQGLSLMEEACVIAKNQTAYGRKTLYIQLLAEARLINKDYSLAQRLSAEAVAVGIQYREDANIARSRYILGQSYLDAGTNEAEGINLVRMARRMADKLGLKPLLSACDGVLREARAA